MAKKSGFTAPTKETPSSDLGATVELGTLGDTTVKGVIDVDISPLSADINYDVSSNDLGVSGEVGLPGGVVSIGGGVIIDLDTGKIVGGSASLGFGGAEVEVSIVGCEQTIQITYWGIGFAISKDICEPEPEPEPSPKISFDFPQPKPEPSPKADPRDFPDNEGFLLCEIYAPVANGHFIFGFSKDSKDFYKQVSSTSYSYSIPSTYTEFNSKDAIQKIFTTTAFQVQYQGESNDCYPKERNGISTKNTQIWRFSKRALTALWDNPRDVYPTVFMPSGFYFRQTSVFFRNSLFYTNNVRELVKFINSINYLKDYGSDNTTNKDSWYNGACGWTASSGYLQSKIIKYIALNNVDVSSNILRRPNPPEIMSNECCDASVSMLRKLMQVLDVDNVLSGKYNIKEFDKAYSEVVKWEQKEADRKKNNPSYKPRPYPFELKNYREILFLELINNYQADKVAKALEVDKILENGLTLPCELFAPEAGDAEIKLTGYMQLFNILFRTLDHRTPGQIEITIKDANKTKEGEQPLNFKSINATGYYKALYETVLEAKSENGDQLQMLVRLAWLTTQIMKVVTIANENIKVIHDYFSIPIKVIIEKVTIPFDITLGAGKNKGKGKGFGKNKSEPSEEDILKIIEEDTEESAERILSKLANVWEMPTKIKKFAKGGDFWFFSRNSK